MQQENAGRVTVNIMGNEYKLKGDSDPGRIVEAVKYVNDILQKLLRTNSHINQHKLLLLTCINLADEIFKLKNELNSKSLPVQQMKIEQEQTNQTPDNKGSDNDQLA